MNSLTAVSISKHWKPAFKVLLGLGLLFSLIAVVDFDLLVASIERADRQLLLAGLLIYSMQGIFESRRLQIAFADFNIGFIDGVRLFLIGLFFGNFMPGLIGMDIYQVYHMHTIRPGLLRPLSLSLFLRLTGLFINLLLAMLALSFGTKKWKSGIDFHLDDVAIPDWMLIITLFMLIVSAMMLVSSWGRSRLRFLYEKIYETLWEFFHIVRSFSVIQHAAIGFLGIFIILCRAASFYILVQAFGSEISGDGVILVVTGTALATLIPISFAGLGIREISATAILIAFGIAPPEAVAISLVSRCFIWILSLVGGVWFVVDKDSTGKIRI